MSDGQKRRARRRRKVSRGLRRTLINIIFAPSRVPKIKQDTVDFMMNLCEITAVIFAFALVMHMAVPSVIKTGLVVFVGIVFAALLLAIKFSDYQEKIEQYRYYGFRI